MKIFWKNSKISYIIRQLCLLCTYQKLLQNETTIHIEAQKAHQYAFMIHKMISNAILGNVEKNWKIMKKCACCHHIIKKVSWSINVFKINFTWFLMHFEPLFSKKQFLHWKTAYFDFALKIRLFEKCTKIEQEEKYDKIALYNESNKLKLQKSSWKKFF